MLHGYLLRPGIALCNFPCLLHGVMTDLQAQTERTFLPTHIRVHIESGLLGIIDLGMRSQNSVLLIIAFREFPLCQVVPHRACPACLVVGGIDRGRWVG